MIQIYIVVSHGVFFGRCVIHLGNRFIVDNSGIHISQREYCSRLKSRFWQRQFSSLSSLLGIEHLPVAHQRAQRFYAQERNHSAPESRWNLWLNGIMDFKRLVTRSERTGEKDWAKNTGKSCCFDKRSCDGLQRERGPK